MARLPLTIKITVDYEPYTVLTEDYISAKTKDLKNFGYTNITEAEVKKSVQKILSGKPVENIIDGFVDKDIVKKS